MFNKYSIEDAKKKKKKDFMVQLVSFENWLNFSGHLKEQIWDKTSFFPGNQGHLAAKKQRITAFSQVMSKRQCFIHWHLVL